MAVEDPGTLQVTCDECGEECEMATTEFAGSPKSFGVDSDTMAEHGWLDDGGSTYCPKCSADYKEDG